MMNWRIGWLVALATFGIAGCTDGGQFLPTQVVFTSDRSGTQQVYIMKANGDDVRQLSTGSSAVDASMSAAGTKIAYAKQRAGNWDIFLNNEQGTNEQARTEGRSDEHSPKFNKNGSRIVYVIGTGNLQEIWRMDSNGENVEQLTENEFADFSPNFLSGSEIVFVSNRTGNNEIWTMEGDGSDQVQVTKDGGDDIMPASRPSGDLIIFSSNRTGTYQLYTIRRDGTDLTQLTTTAGNKFGASFSLDGNKIFFYGDATGNMDVYSINADGSSETNLTNNAAEDTKVGTWVAP
jgi:Tol biopolymer transport system component